MKTKILLLFLFGWIEMLLAQQEVNQEIIYDFSTGKFEKSIIKPRQKTPTILKIKNINTYFYDIQIQSKDINMNSESLYDNALDIKKTGIIKIDTTLVIGILDTKSIAVMPPYLKPTKSDDKIPSNLKAIKDLEDSLTTKKNLLQNDETALINLQKEKHDVEKIIFEKSLIDDRKNSLKENSIANDSILKAKKKSLDSLKTQYQNSYFKVYDDNRIMDINKDIITIRSNLETKVYNVTLAENRLDRALLDMKDRNEILIKLNDGISKINSKYYELDAEFIEVLKIAGAYNNFIYKIFRPGVNKREYNNIKNPKEKFETVAVLDYEKISGYYAQIKKFNQVYSEFQSLYNKTMNQNTLILHGQDEDLLFINSTLQSEYTRLKNVIDEMLKKVESLDLNTKLSAVEVYNRELQNDETFEYVSDPIQGLGDYIEFDVTIKPKTQFKEVFAKNQNRRFKYSEYLRGGVRYDFSVGTVFDFVNKDEFYENRNDTIVKTSNNKYYPTLAGFFHVSLRSNSLCSAGFSLGASLNITEFDINSLFIGPSLLIGKKEKIIFTAGMSFRKTKQLERGHYDGEKIVGASSIDDYMTNNFRIGVFAGISYNLTKKQKASLKIANNGQ